MVEDTHAVDTGDPSTWGALSHDAFSLALERFFATLRADSEIRRLEAALEDGPGWAAG